MIPQSRLVLVALKASLVLLFLLSLAAHPASAQEQLGTPKYESFGGGPFDTVNLGNLNGERRHFRVPAGGVTADARDRHLFNLLRTRHQRL